MRSLKKTKLKPLLLALGTFSSLYSTEIMPETEKPEQQFEKRAVKVGLSDGIKIEIKEGLAENEKVRGAIVDPNKK